MFSDIINEKVLYIVISFFFLIITNILVEYIRKKVTSLKVTPLKVTPLKVYNVKRKFLVYNTLSIENIEK